MSEPIIDTVKMDFATKFRIINYEYYQKIQVYSPWPGSMDTFNYILTRKKEIAERFDKVINTKTFILPLHRFVCFSTTHLPYFEMLNETDKLSGFPTTDYITSKKIRDRVDKGFITDLGPTNDINYETLLSIGPDIIFAFNMGTEVTMLEKIRRSGLDLVLNADYLEEHPLGRAEWIKFFAAFFNKSNAADSIFSIIKSNYLQTRDRAMEVEKRPVVFTGIVYGDTWFMPGGNHYGAIFFEEAGADYPWSDNPSGETLRLSFESVYQKAGNADYWVGTATYNSLEQIAGADSRYTGFNAFRSGNVYNYIARIGPKGGNDYFEMGYARPDLILMDLVKIFHPGLMQDHTFYFYKKLY